MRSTTSRGSAEVACSSTGTWTWCSSLQLVDAALAKVQQTLPSTARITTNRLTFASFPVLGYSLTSDTVPQTQLWEIATYDLKPPLNRVDGVSTVMVQGGAGAGVSCGARTRRCSRPRASPSPIWSTPSTLRTSCSRPASTRPTTS